MLLTDSLSAHTASSPFGCASRALAPCGAGSGASFFSRTCALCWFSPLIAPLGAWLQQHAHHLPSPLPDSSLSQEKFCEFNCSIRAPPKQMVW